MTTLMVIGGSGFFGKSILDAYFRDLLKPWGVTGIIILSRNASLLKVIHPHLVDRSITLIDADIALCTELPYADFVIHAAASTDAKNYLNKPAEEKKNILAGTVNYCRLAKKYHQKSNIVYCSSGAVYGQQHINLQGLSEETIFDRVDVMPQGKRDYAVAKRDAEVEIKKLGESGLNVSIARCFAFVGPYLRRDQHFAIGNFIEDGFNRRPILVKATHLVFRSYMYADDLVVWLMTLASNASNKCLIMNVGSDEAISMSDLAFTIANFFGVKAIIPGIEASLVDRYIPSIKKANSVLGLSLRFDLHASIEATIHEVERINAFKLCE